MLIKFFHNTKSLEAEYRMTANFKNDQITKKKLNNFEQAKIDYLYFK